MIVASMGPTACFHWREDWGFGTDDDEDVAAGGYEFIYSRLEDTVIADLFKKLEGAHSIAYDWDVCSNDIYDVLRSVNAKLLKTAVLSFSSWMNRSRNTEENNEDAITSEIILRSKISSAWAVVLLPALNLKRCVVEMEHYSGNWRLWNEHLRDLSEASAYPTDIFSTSDILNMQQGLLLVM